MSRDDQEASELVWTEVYIALNPVEASAVNGLLEAEEMESRQRDMGVSLYPVTLGPLGETRISVRARDADEARDLLRQAVADGVLPGGLVTEGPR
ncbi:MAG: DUF2007 domain-containing protein [Deltaproteobacteria bacterium]|nr:DUF2007 domain-containing protein [Deltaproteobacteria bacterium]